MFTAEDSGPAQTIVVGLGPGEMLLESIRQAAARPCEPKAAS